MPEDDELIVRKIVNGVVIDHIKPGMARILLPYIGGNSDSSRVVLENAQSEIYGRKDVIKLDGRDNLTPQELTLLWILSQKATINVIKDRGIESKYSPETPKKVVGLLSCPHPGCITRDPSEHVTTRFYVDDTGNVLTCAYCDLPVQYSEATRYLIDPDDMK